MFDPTKVGIIGSYLGRVDGLTDLEGVVAAIVIDIMVVALGVGYLLPEASKSGGLLPAAVFAMLVVLSLSPWIVMLKS